MAGADGAPAAVRSPRARRKPRISKAPVWREPTAWEALPLRPEAGDSRSGREVIRAQVRNVTARPGVYRMLGADDEVLYVGKAKNLRKRLTSYTRTPAQAHRIGRMIGLTAAVEIVATHTEVEALLLEANLIKRLRPRFNIILRDDKSFPFILLRRDHPWPQITKYRGARTAKGEYFGPFASAGAGQRHHQRPAAGLPLAILLRQRVRQPHPALPTVPDQALHGALRRPHRHRGLRCPGRRNPRVSQGPEPGTCSTGCRRACRKPAPRSSSRPPPSTATASAPCRRSRHARASIPAP